jgi:uncharacterized iron-regulated membrane protein
VSPSKIAGTLDYTWRRWISRPQSLWIRKALFQIHFWVGIGIGLYVVVISISGSAIVFRGEIAGSLSHRTIVASAEGGPRLTAQELEQRAGRAYPAAEVLNIVEPQMSDQAVAVIFERGGRRFERLFDPYTGRELGDPHTPADRALGWLADLHDNLLSGLTGRILNGLGALLLVLLTLTGALIWWPGKKNWRRSTRILWPARLARVNWDVHSAVGFWCSILVLIWGISGVLLCFPGSLDSLLNSDLRRWLTRLHFGRFNGVTEAIWTVLGLAPAVLAGTGAVMWWYRVLSKSSRPFSGRDFRKSYSSRRKASQANRKQ